MGNVIARVVTPEWLSVVTAESARIQTEENGDRFLVLTDGHRYDLKPDMPDFRLMEFDSYGFRLESNASESSAEAVRRMAESPIKARPTQIGRASWRERVCQYV